MAYSTTTKKRQTKDNYPTQFKCNNSKDSDFYTIASKFGTFFSNIGQILANKIPEVDVNQHEFNKSKYLRDFSSFK